jgi:putative transposase
MIHAELTEGGERINHKRVARLMRLHGLVGVTRRKPHWTTRRNPAAAAAPDLVERTFRAERPDQLWVADITYVPTWAGFLYRAIVLDVCSRRIVGWAMATHLQTELVLDALNMAIGQRQPAAVIHHSDQGCQSGFNWSSQQRLYGWNIGTDLAPRPVFSSRGSYEAWC